MKETKSKDFKTLIERLEKDNALHREKMAQIYNLDVKERIKHQEDLEIHQNYITYHNEIISFVGRLDKELYGGD